MSKTKRFIIAELDGIQWIEEMVLNSEPITNIAQAVKKLNDLSEENEQLKKENKKLNCIIKQLEEKYEDKGFSLVYGMGECE